MTVSREFTALWWAGRPTLQGGLIIAVLAVASVAAATDWPLWSAAVLWLVVQLVAMTGWAAWQIIHPRFPVEPSREGASDA